MPGPMTWTSEEMLAIFRRHVWTGPEVSHFLQYSPGVPRLSEREVFAVGLSPIPEAKTSTRYLMKSDPRMRSWKGRPGKEDGMIRLGIYECGTPDPVSSSGCLRRTVMHKTGVGRGISTSLERLWWRRCSPGGLRVPRQIICF